MKTVIRIVVLLPGVLFVVIGVRWLVVPVDMATELGFLLADGIGRSSQIGDFAAFFLTAGVCILMGIVTGKRLWLYPPAMLLLLAAVGRVLAWALHDAAFAGGMILFETGVSTLLLVASRWLEPSAATKEPSAATREPSAATREPSAATREPSAAIKEPSALTKKPQV